MARVIGPLMSLSASGSVANTVTFASWKGRDYARTYFIPQNPSEPKQVNVRSAMTLLVAKWQTLNEEAQTAWNEFAVSFKMSGFNQFIKRGMLEYISQLGTEDPPTVVAVTGNPPDEEWTWTGT